MTLHLTLLKLHSRQACFALGFLAAVSSLVSGGGAAGDMVGGGPRLFLSQNGCEGGSLLLSFVGLRFLFLVSPSSGLGAIAILKNRVGYLRLYAWFCSCKRQVAGGSTFGFLGFLSHYLDDFHFELTLPKTLSSTNIISLCRITCIILLEHVLRIRETKYQLCKNGNQINLSSRLDFGSVM